MSDVNGADEPDDTGPAIPTSADTSVPQDDGDVTGSVSGGDQTGAAGPKPYEQEGPNTPEMEALNTREKALDKSGLGGAFGAAQRKQIADQRNALVQQLITHALQAQAGGPSVQEGPNNRPNPNAGAIPTSDQTEPEQAPDAGPLGNAVRGIGQAIAKPFKDAAAGYSAGWQRLLSGQGAMDHKTAEVVATSVNPDGSNPTESLDAVHKATERGGPDAGLAFMQNRVGIYNASRAWAAAAYDGKALSSAVDAANRAFKALPLAEQVHFTTGANGSVTATVSGANEGDQPISYPLPSANFRELMRGNSGFAYDMLMQGPNAVLSKLAGEDHGVKADPESQGVAPDPQAGKVPDSFKAKGVNQATWNVAHSLYPWSSQTAQRNRFLLGEMQQASTQKHQLDVAKQQGVNRTNVADLQGGVKRDVAAGNNQTTLTKEGMRGETSLARGHEHEVEATKRTQARVDMQDRATRARVQTAHDQLVAHASQATDKAFNQVKIAALRGLLAGTTTWEDTDTELKKHGSSVDEILGNGAAAGGGGSRQQAPAAPSTRAPASGAAQTGNGQKPIGRDKNGTLIYAQ